MTLSRKIGVALDKLLTKASALECEFCPLRETCPKYKTVRKEERKRDLSTNT